MPKKYTFIENLSFKEMKKNIEKIGFVVKRQVVNFNNKTIGMIVENADKTGFIPTKPSAIDNKYEYVFMDADGLWKEYSETIELLNEIYDKSTKAGITIPVKPEFKVEENGLIVTLTIMFLDHLPSIAHFFFWWFFIHKQLIFKRVEKFFFKVLVLF